MIFTLARAGATLDEERYTQAALKAAQFIKGHLWFDGVLLRRWRDGEALFKGGLDEHAFLIQRFLALFETGQGSEWLDWAMELSHALKVNFKRRTGLFSVSMPKICT